MRRKLSRAAALATEAFYVGALGSRQTQQRRVETLEAQLKQLTASLCETRRVLDEARRAVR